MRMEMDHNDFAQVQNEIGIIQNLTIKGTIGQMPPEVALKKVSIECYVIRDLLRNCLLVQDKEDGNDKE